MRNEAADFNRKDELSRNLARPVTKRPGFRKPVKAAVDLHGVKVLGVKSQPLALGKISRAEAAVAPVAIVPAARADKDFACHAILVSLKAGQRGSRRLPRRATGFSGLSRSGSWEARLDIPGSEGS